MSCVRFVLAVLASLWLVGCGGKEEQAPTTALDVSPQALRFEAVAGGALPPTQLVKANFVGHAVLVGYPEGAQEPSWLEIVHTTSDEEGATFRFSVTTTATSQYPVTRETVVRFVTANEDQSSPRFLDITVTYVLRSPQSEEGLGISPNRLDFTAFSGQSGLPAAQSVKVTSRQPVSYSITARYTGSTQDWLGIPSGATTPQTVSIRPDRVGLPPGKHEAVLSFIPNNGQPPAQLTVVFTVSAFELQATPSQPMLRVDSSTTAAQLTSPLGLSSASVPLSWRVVSTSVPWLDNTTVSGSTETHSGLNLVVPPSALAELPNGTHSGTLTLAYGNASTPELQLVVPVKLTVALPRIRTIMPYATEAGRSLSHVLRGDGFSGLQPGQGISIGSTVTSTYQVISDTELHLDSPALPPGAHALSVGNALGLARPGPTLHAIQTPAFTEFTLARNRSPRRVIYDPLRTAFYSVDYDSGGSPVGLYRYRYLNGTWQEDLYVSQPGLYDAAMDVDGQSLYLSFRTGLYRLNLADASATPQLLRSLNQSTLVAVMNDGYLLTTTGTCPYTATAPDGRRTVLFKTGCSSPPGPLQVFDASSTQPQYIPVELNASRSRVAVDRTARYVAISDAVYNSQWHLAAGLGAPLAGLTFSPDARRLFGFLDDHAQSKQVMYVFDTATAPTGGRFPLLSQSVLAGSQAGDGLGTHGFVTPDGRTLLKADFRRFHVYPIPGALQ
ncbi:hypothetical protein [Archangium sp.]|uniref:hypothetical protein n=1 Tax=Archangium sp. TaxID=1872627 RepID=UPI002D46A3AE|nr:hypothetical protein [Archangium sp.]HYO58804.1 hypothetical protein [Archangium sp.]